MSRLAYGIVFVVLAVIKTVADQRANETEFERHCRLAR
jgi:hypothetical protein